MPRCSRFPRRLIAAGLPLVAALSLPAIAPAADVTVGGPLSAAAETNSPPGVCPTNTDCIAFTAGSGGPTAVAPSDGTVDRWRVRAGSGGSPVRLRILRPNGSGGFAGAGTSATKTTSGMGIDTFTTSLPIHRGDVIALENDSNALIYATSASASSFYFSGPNGGETSTFTPQVLADGSTGAPTGSDGNLAVQVNADIAPAPTSGPTGPTGPTTPGPTGPTTPGPAGPTTIQVAGNPFGLPSTGRCADRRRFRLPIHQPRANGAVIRATVRVNGRVVRTVTGRSLASVTLSRLPAGRFRVVVQALTTRNLLIVSARTYSGCHVGRRHDTHR